MSLSFVATSLQILVFLSAVGPVIYIKGFLVKQRQKEYLYIPEDLHPPIYVQAERSAKKKTSIKTNSS
jgi:hypothetical protein